MKFRATSSWLMAATLMTVGVLTLGAVRAAEPDFPMDVAEKVEKAVKLAKAVNDLNVQPEPDTSPQPERTRSLFSGGGEIPNFGRTRVGANPSSSIRKAAEAVRDAKGDDAKSAAQKKLAEVLNKSYDEDMVRREQELKQIEERLAKLRELLERRRAKKQDIIELQTKVALNEAEGLGFYDSDHPTKANPFNVSPFVRIDAFGAPSGPPVPPVPPAGPIPAPKPRSSSSSSSGSSSIDSKESSR